MAGDEDPDTPTPNHPRSSDPVSGDPTSGGPTSGSPVSNAATWRHGDGGVEIVDVRFENGGWTVDGRIIRDPAGDAGTGHDDLHYVLRTDASWQVRQFLLFRDAEDADLWLAADGTGRWGEVNGSWRDDLEGCVDVHVSGTVTAHLALVRRESFAVGHRGAALVAVVDPETLHVRVVSREAMRVAERRWQFFDDGDAAAAPDELVLDEHALVLDDGGRTTRER